MIYRITLIVGPVDQVPAFGRAVARIVGVLKRAGMDVTVRIEQTR